MCFIKSDVPYVCIMKTNVRCHTLIAAPEAEILLAMHVIRNIITEM